MPIRKNLFILFEMTTIGAFIPRSSVTDHPSECTITAFHDGTFMKLLGYVHPLRQAIMGCLQAFKQESCRKSYSCSWYYLLRERISRSVLANFCLSVVYFGCVKGPDLFLSLQVIFTARPSLQASMHHHCVSHRISKGTSFRQAIVHRLQATIFVEQETYHKNTQFLAIACFVFRASELLQYHLPIGGLFQVRKRP